MYSTSQTDKFKLTNMSTEDKISFYTKGDTLYKNENSSTTMRSLTTTRRSIRKLDMILIGTYVIFLGVDSLQTNTDNRTEMQK